MAVGIPPDPNRAAKPGNDGTFPVFLRRYRPGLMDIARLGLNPNVERRTQNPPGLRPRGSTPPPGTKPQTRVVSGFQQYCPPKNSSARGWRRPGSGYSAAG